MARTIYGGHQSSNTRRKFLYFTHQQNSSTLWIFLLAIAYLSPSNLLPDKMKNLLEAPSSWARFLNLVDELVADGHGPACPEIEEMNLTFVGWQPTLWVSQSAWIVDDICARNNRQIDRNLGENSPVASHKGGGTWPTRRSIGHGVNHSLCDQEDPEVQSDVDRLTCPTAEMD